MMLLDELIPMMIGMSDDQLRKIKSFILMKLSIKDPTDTKENSVTSCPICKSNHIVKNGKRMANSNFSAKDVSTLSVYPQTLSPLKVNIRLKHGQTMFQV